MGYFYGSFMIFSSFCCTQKIGVCKILMFLKEVCYAHQGCIYLIKKCSKIVKYYYNLK